MYQKFSSSYYWLTSILIIVYNALFYIFTWPVVCYIGYIHKTDLNKVVCLTIVVCLIVDMIFLPIMIGMNLVEYGHLSWFKFFNSGKHTDFGAKWYTDVGY